MLAAAALIALTACAPSNTPSSYDDQAQKAFVLACTGDAPDFGGTTTTLAGSSYCGCAFAVFVENVPFDSNDQAARLDNNGNQVFETYSGKTYLEYNASMKDDPNVLPEGLVSKLEQCATSSNPSAEVSPIVVGGAAPD